MERFCNLVGLTKANYSTLVMHQNRASFFYSSKHMSFCLYAYSIAKGGHFGLKKLFPAEPTLKITNAEKIRYSGTYQVRNITTEQYECEIDQFQMHVIGKEIAVQFLQEDGFLLTCEKMQKITIERIQR